MAKKGGRKEMKKENNKSFKDFFQKWKLLRSKRC
jgi:hypothetical protein